MKKVVLTGGPCSGKTTVSRRIQEAVSGAAKSPALVYISGVLTLVAGLGHASLGSVDWALLAQLLAGSLPGIWLGSRLVSRTPELLIRSGLSLLLAWAGAKLVLI